MLYIYKLILKFTSMKLSHIKNEDLMDSQLTEADQTIDEIIQKLKFELESKANPNDEILSECLEIEEIENLFQTDSQELNLQHLSVTKKVEYSLEDNSDINIAENICYDDNLLLNSEAENIIDCNIEIANDVDNDLGYLKEENLFLYIKNQHENENAHSDVMIDDERSKSFNQDEDIVNNFTSKNNNKTLSLLNIKEENSDINEKVNTNFLESEISKERNDKSCIVESSNKKNILEKDSELDKEIEFSIIEKATQDDCNDKNFTNQVKNNVIQFENTEEQNTMTFINTMETQTDENSVNTNYSKQEGYSKQNSDIKKVTKILDITNQSQDLPISNISNHIEYHEINKNKTEANIVSTEQEESLNLNTKYHTFQTTSPVFFEQDVEEFFSNHHIILNCIEKNSDSIRNSYNIIDYNQYIKNDSGITIPKHKYKIDITEPVQNDSVVKKHKKLRKKFNNVKSIQKSNLISNDCLYKIVKKKKHIQTKKVFNDLNATKKHSVHLSKCCLVLITDIYMKNKKDEKVSKNTVINPFEYKKQYELRSHQKDCEKKMEKLEKNIEIKDKIVIKKVKKLHSVNKKNHIINLKASNIFKRMSKKMQKKAMRRKQPIRTINVKKEIKEMCTVKKKNNNKNEITNKLVVKHKFCLTLKSKNDISINFKQTNKNCPGTLNIKCLFANSDINKLTISKGNPKIVNKKNSANNNLDHVDEWKDDITNKFNNIKKKLDQINNKFHFNYQIDVQQLEKISKKTFLRDLAHLIRICDEITRFLHSNKKVEILQEQNFVKLNTNLILGRKKLNKYSMKNFFTYTINFYSIQFDKLKELDVKIEYTEPILVTIQKIYNFNKLFKAEHRMFYRKITPFRCYSQKKKQIIKKGTRDNDSDLELHYLHLRDINVLCLLIQKIKKCNVEQTNLGESYEFIFTETLKKAKKNFLSFSEDFKASKIKKTDEKNNKQKMVSILKQFWYFIYSFDSFIMQSNNYYKEFDYVFNIVDQMYVFLLEKKSYSKDFDLFISKYKSIAKKEGFVWKIDIYDEINKFLQIVRYLLYCRVYIFHQIL